MNLTRVPQVCNTVYPRLQRSNPQCVCPRGAPRCSQLMLSSDGHSVDLVTNTSMGVSAVILPGLNSRQVLFQLEGIRCAIRM